MIFLFHSHRIRDKITPFLYIGGAPCGTKASTLRIIEKLKELYPEGLCSLQYEKDYELLFAVRLSAQCTDARVNLVTPALFARFPTLEAFAAADPREVGEYIHSCGFYNGKSKDLVACAQQLWSDSVGRFPTIWRISPPPRRGDGKPPI